MDIYKEKLIEMVDLAEKQLKTIRLLTDFTDIHLSPQIQAIREAKELLEIDAGDRIVKKTKYQLEREKYQYGEDDEDEDENCRWDG